MQRILKISKFRNIGFDKEECLILNHSFKTKEMGDLIILIGPNNSGKSNVLDALIKINTKNISKNDLTTLSYEENDRKPVISLNIKNNNFFISHILDNDNFFTYSNVCSKNFTFSQMKEDVEEIFKEYEGSINDIKNEINKILESKQYNLEKQFKLICIKLRHFYNINYQSSYYYYRNNNFIKKLKDTNMFNFCFKPSDEKEKLFKEEFHKKFSINTFPTIISYIEKNISQSNLVVSPEEIDSNIFFKYIFNSLKVNTANIKRAYENFYVNQNHAILKKEEKSINKKLDALNNNFNKLYFAGDEKYKFEILLQKEEIGFSMTRGEDEPIILEHQSTGFKWFFNFYFNFLNGQQLNPGDIVIMDEPGTNLHPKGLEELRKFIKDFAIKNDITIIIATHSPFLISTDNFEEIRVVSMKNNRAYIDNLFTAVNMNDPDSLLPIKEALTIKQNILYDLDTEVIWVEGITDYNYLTLFKKLLKKENISFLPFQGVGKGENAHKKIIEKLQSIKFHKRNILVDGDTPGIEFKNFAKNTSFSNIICISDLNTKEKTFKTIEDLFSEEDKNKFASLRENSEEYKKASCTATMKKICKKDDFTEETIKNFQRLFELLTE